MNVRAPSATVVTGKTKCSSGEDLERNDGSSERPFFMSRELHEILSKTKPDEPDDSSAPAPVQADEETPLQQQAQEDMEIQLKQEAVLRTENKEEEQQPLTQEQVATATAEEGDQQQQDKTPAPQTPQEPQTQTTEPHTTPLQNGFVDIEPEEKKEPEEAPQPAVAAAEEEEQAEEEKPKENGPQETDTPLTPQEWILNKLGVIQPKGIWHH